MLATLPSDAKLKCALFGLPSLPLVAAPLRAVSATHHIPRTCCLRTSNMSLNVMTTIKIKATAR